jgi:hypothetical protein
MMLKALGIDFKQIDAIVQEMLGGIQAVNNRLTKIEERLTAIQNGLSPGKNEEAQILQITDERKSANG